MKTDNKTVRVTAGVIVRNGRVLICRRSSGALAGMWEFPGGKVEPGEKPSSCLAREIYEELGIKIRIRRYLGRIDHHYPHISVRLLFYHSEYVNGRIVMTDHDRSAWVSMMRVRRYQLASADLAFLPRLEQVFRSSLPEA